MAVQNQKKQLMERQQLELQKQHVTEMLEIEKSNETDKDRIAELESELESILGTTNALMMKERAANDQLEEARKAAVKVYTVLHGDTPKVSSLNFFLRNKNAYFIQASSLLSQIYHIVSMKEFTLIYQVLETYGDEDKIGNKLMGCINKAPWKAACKKRFKYHVDGWDLVMATIISEWEDRMKNESYYPYKNVRLGEGDNWKVSLSVVLYAV